MKKNHFILFYITNKYYSSTSRLHRYQHHIKSELLLRFFRHFRLLLSQTLNSSSRFLIVVSLGIIMSSVVFLWVFSIFLKQNIKQSKLFDESIRAILPNRFKLLFLIDMEHGLISFWH